MGVMAVRDPADRVAEDFDRRLREMLIVVCRARLAKILEFPRFFDAGLDIRLRSNAGESAQLVEAGVRTCASTQEDRIVCQRILRGDTPEVRVDGAIHGPVERLASLDPAIEQPPPSRLLLRFSIRRFAVPRDVPP